MALAKGLARLSKVKTSLFHVLGTLKWLGLFLRAFTLFDGSLKVVC